MAGSSGARSAGVAVKAISLSVAFEVASRLAFAQGAADPMADLRTCPLIEREERLECLENLSRNIVPARPASAADNWIVSATTSPVDYMPIITATTFSRDASSMQLSIRCRAGRTELVVAGPIFSRSREDYAISYRINDDPPMQLAAVPSRRGKSCRPSCDPNRRGPGRAFPAWRTGDGAREARRGVQMATRRSQVTQLVVVELSWEMCHDKD